jgi:predicted AlkP superfamily phosphohydrolase/phosphomutase
MSNHRFTRVVVVGLDGLEPSIVEPMLLAGELPNLARLAAQGGYSRVQTTCPAQTPVAWSTFATGVNPGAHGIFDFVRRNPASYLPDLGLNRYEQKNPFVPPRVVNLRRGQALWEVLAADGIASTCLRCPCTYPPDATIGKMLSGLGVPDLRGGFGTATFYTATAGAASQEGEQVIQIHSDPDVPVTTYLPGPLDSKTRLPHRRELTIEPKPAFRQAVIRVQGSSEALTVQENQWSPWLRVRFKLGMFQSVAGIVRFYLARLGPTIELYASPINFDPEEPLFPISFPADYAGELADEIGMYYTAGMAEDHSGLNNGRFSEAAFLEQCATLWQEREKMMLFELDRFREGFFYCLYDTPDRVQHMFWRFREADHPANLGRLVPAEYQEVIEEHYRIADTIVGKAMEHADDRTLLIILSDHGFNSFQRGVNLNTWLHGQGLLTLKNGTRPGPDAADLLQSVDWSRTKAYATGLTGIYLNLKGRERDGIVPAGEADKLKGAIAAALTGLADPARGRVAINCVVPRERVYRGPYIGEAPDLLVNFAPPYRTSWSTAKGGVPAHEFEDNTRCWSGDHIVDPTLVPGVLWMNHPFRPGARLLDLAPTILQSLGSKAGPEMEGASLLP